MPPAPATTLTFPLAAGIVRVLEEVLVQKRPADRALERLFKEHAKWTPAQRGFVAGEAYAHLRAWRWHCHLAGLPDRRFLDPAFLTENRIWEAWAAGHFHRTGQAPSFRECAGFDEKAIRRRAAQEVPPALRLSLTDWLYELGRHDLGEAWPGLLGVLNEPAPLFLRVQALRTTPADLAASLAADGFAAHVLTDPLTPAALRLGGRHDVFGTAAFRDGLFEIQDAASQRIAPFLDLKPGQRVIDACAGAGGKTLHIATLLHNKGTVIALDTHPRKLEELRRRARRAALHNIQARLVEDAATVKRLHGSADRVLIDAPCSGLGVLRRNPEIKWRLTPEDLERLHAIQSDLLERYARLVKPGGKLVYATCSLLTGENRDRIDAFLAAHSEAWRLEDELVLLPQSGGGDGFYAARLVRGTDCPA